MLGLWCPGPGGHTRAAPHMAPVTGRGPGAHILTQFWSSNRCLMSDICWLIGAHFNVLTLKHFFVLSFGNSLKYVPLVTEGSWDTGPLRLWGQGSLRSWAHLNVWTFPELLWAHSVDITEVPVLITLQSSHDTQHSQHKCFNKFTGSGHLCWLLGRWFSS